MSPEFEKKDAWLSVHGGLFKENWSVCVGPYDMVQDYLEKSGFKRTDTGRPKLAKTIEVEHHNGPHECIIWLREEWLTTDVESVAALAHEALHAVIWMLRSRGLCDASILDETGNYMVEYLVFTIMTWRKEVEADRAKKATIAFEFPGNEFPGGAGGALPGCVTVR